MPIKMVSYGSNIQIKNNDSIKAQDEIMGKFLYFCSVKANLEFIKQKHYHSLYSKKSNLIKI